MSPQSDFAAFFRLEFELKLLYRTKRDQCEIARVVCLYFGNTRSFKANGQVDLSSKFGTAEKGRNTFVILMLRSSIFPMFFGDIFIDSHSNKRSGKSANCEYYLPCQCTNLFWISIESYLAVLAIYQYIFHVTFRNNYVAQQGQLVRTLTESILGKKNQIEFGENCQ